MSQGGRERRPGWPGGLQRFTREGTAFLPESQWVTQEESPAEGREVLSPLLPSPRTSAGQLYTLPLRPPTPDRAMPPLKPQALQGELGL